ncbi:hypothetical protein [Pantoea sp. 1B4]|uniref:hypothetical protein n=1 Tax=Pantoea sp. 1B4 TaxID=2804760 RepID=UPI0031FBA70C
MINAIRSVNAGQRYIASDIAQQMALSQIEPQKAESPLQLFVGKGIADYADDHPWTKGDGNFRAVKSQS